MRAGLSLRHIQKRIKEFSHEFLLARLTRPHGHHHRPAHQQGTGLRLVKGGQGGADLHAAVCPAEGTPQKELRLPRRCWRLWRELQALDAGAYLGSGGPGIHAAQQFPFVSYACGIRPDSERILGHRETRSLTGQARCMVRHLGSHGSCAPGITLKGSHVQVDPCCRVHLGHSRVRGSLSPRGGAPQGGCQDCQARTEWPPPAWCCVNRTGAVGEEGCRGGEVHGKYPNDPFGSGSRARTLRSLDFALPRRVGSMMLAHLWHP